MIDKFATPRGLAVGIMGIGLLVAAAIGLGAYALVRQYKTEKQVTKIARRVFLIEQPTPAQRRAGVKKAVKELTASEAQSLLTRLLKSATPAQKKKLQEVVKGGGPATNPGSGPSGPGAKPGPSPNVPPVTVPSVTTPIIPTVTTPPITLPPVTVPCLPPPVQHC